MSSSAPRAQLCIWTAVDPAHEADFNRWYDREHMQERVALPGFQSARRFKAVDPRDSRPYLALYDTDGIEVFRSDAYRTAFQHQTPWSLANFGRMRGTQRRVGTLDVEIGDGEGGALALVVVPPEALAGVDAAGRLAAVVQQDDVVRCTLMRTEVTLSAPVTAGAAAPPADALLSVEATSAEGAAQAARALAEAVGIAVEAVHVFRLMWRHGRR